MKDIFVEILPAQIFYQWMKVQGKEGGQNKFPRVLKKAQLENWQHFIANDKPALE